MANGTTVVRREVHVLFAGLFFFHFAQDDSEGYVTALETTNHPLCITFNDTPKTRIELARTVIKKLPQDLYVKKYGTTQTTPYAVSRRGGWDPPPNRFLKPKGKPPYPFGWIADFENAELHGNIVNKKKGVPPRILHFWTGEFYTYEVGRAFAVYTTPDNAQLLGRIASVIGVKISLNPGESLVFQAGNFNWPVPSHVSKILVDHTCPEYKAQDYDRLVKEAATRISTDLPYVAVSNDMQQYYEELFDVHADERFKFVALPDNKVFTDSRPFICYGAGGSQTSSLPES